MELSTILELVKAGFTKDEIMQMAQPQTPVADPVPVVQPVETPTPVETHASVNELIPAPVDPPVAVAVPAPQPAPTQQEAQPTMAELMQSIAKLTSAVQANAIAQSVIPAGLSNPPKAEDMLAEIIRPTFKERG